MNQADTGKSSEPAGNVPSSLRFGILCTGTVFQQWQAEAIRKLLRDGHRPVVLIRDARETPWLPPSGWEGIRTRLFRFLDRRLFHPAEKDPVDLAAELKGTPVLACRVTRKGHSDYFDENDLHAIRVHRPDFLLRFGFGILRGEILQAAPYGVWSFHHDDEMKYRGGPPGFWEIVRRDPVSGAILQRLTDRLDAGIVLHKGYLRTSFHSYRENLGRLLAVSAGWPALAANRIARRQARGIITSENPSSLTRAPLFRVPGNLTLAWFLVRLAVSRLGLHTRRLFRPESWNIGIIRQPIHAVALGDTMPPVEWLPPPPRDRYLADPFGFVLDGELRILAEEYDLVAGKAGITLIRPAEPEKRIPAIGSDTHLSYPFLFERNGETWCLPENHASGRVRLYRYDPGSETFLPDRVLLEGVNAVDPTLFKYNDRWWLFFTDRDHSNARLHIWHAPSLADAFTPHAGNPVKTDVRSARPAGTPFVHEGVLYRPAQDGSRTYGGRIAVNRIVKLTPEEFSEETVRFLDPPPGSRWNRGFHTLSAAGGFTLVDGKRYRFSLKHLIHSIVRKPGKEDGKHV